MSIRLQFIHLGWCLENKAYLYYLHYLHESIFIKYYSHKKMFIPILSIENTIYNNIITKTYWHSSLFVPALVSSHFLIFSHEG
jgi:hypothetical protein